MLNLANLVQISPEWNAKECFCFPDLDDLWLVLALPEFAPSLDDLDVGHGLVVLLDLLSDLVQKGHLLVGVGQTVHNGHAKHHQTKTVQSEKEKTISSAKQI